MRFRTLFTLLLSLIVPAGSAPADMCFNFENCYKAAHCAGFQHGERLYDCFDSFSSVLRRARADTFPNSSDFLPVFHANYCKKSQISLKRFSHDDRIITMPFIEESAQNQCGQAASMGIPVGCVRITKIKAALHPIGFMQDCLRKCEESIFI